MSDARQTRYDRRRRSRRTNSEFDSIRGEYRFFECRKTGSQTESKNRFIRFFPYRYTTLAFTLPIFCHLRTKLCPNFGRLRARPCPISFASCPSPNLAGTLEVQSYSTALFSLYLVFLAVRACIKHALVSHYHLCNSDFAYCRGRMSKTSRSEP